VSEIPGFEDFAHIIVDEDIDGEIFQQIELQDWKELGFPFKLSRILMGLRHPPKERLLQQDECSQLAIFFFRRKPVQTDDNILLDVLHQDSSNPVANENSSEEESQRGSDSEDSDSNFNLPDTQEGEEPGSPMIFQPSSQVDRFPSDFPESFAQDLAEDLDGFFALYQKERASMEEDSLEQEGSIPEVPPTKGVINKNQYLEGRVVYFLISFFSLF